MIIQLPTTAQAAIALFTTSKRSLHKPLANESLRGFTSGGNRALLCYASPFTFQLTQQQKVSETTTRQRVSTT